MQHVLRAYMESTAQRIASVRTTLFATPAQDSAIVVWGGQVVPAGTPVPLASMDPAVLTPVTAIMGDGVTVLRDAANVLLGGMDNNVNSVSNRLLLNLKRQWKQRG